MKKQLLSFLFFVAFISIQAQSLCWKITKSKQDYSFYLYGTMHLSDSRLFNFSESMLKAFDKSDVYMMEVDPAKIDYSKIMAMLLKGTGKSIIENLNTEEVSYLDSVLKNKLGVPLVLLDKMEPIILQTIMALPTPTLNSDRNDSIQKFALDFYLNDKAIKANKRVEGIENMDEQMKALQSLSYSEQIEMLKKSIKEKGKDSEDFEKMIGLYLKGDIEGLLKMSDDAGMNPTFNKKIILDRNIRMANRIASLKGKESYFIAIGALHLPGNQGVIELLRKKGYTVEPVL